MSRRHAALPWAVAAAFLALPPLARTQDKAEDVAAARSFLQAKGLPIEGPGLLQFFRERTLSKDQFADLENQVRLLGSSIYSERVKATGLLIKAGPQARKLLLDIVGDPAADLETIRRAEGILKKISDKKDVPVALATARLVAHAPPAGSAQVLLDYVPFAHDGRVSEEVQQTLNVLAVRQGEVDPGEVDPAFLAALKDKQPAKRAAAGEAIVRGGGIKHKEAVGALLADPAPAVRLAVVMALVEAHDRSAIEPLVELLTAVSAEQVWQVEDLLHRLAGDSAPEMWIGPETAANKVQAAWDAWRRKHGDTVDFAKLNEAPAYRGFVLVTLGNAGGAAVKGLTGKIMEVRPNKEIAWQFETVRNPMDAHLVGGNRVLVAEYLDRRVTERDLKGNILWEKPFDLPIACQRLPNGKTFVATRRQLLIIDRDGKETFTYSTNLLNISGAGCARDGQMVFLTTQGKCTWLDAQGKETKSFQVQVGKTFNVTGAIDVLPGHRIVLPLLREGRVAEFDQSGQVVWQANITGPISAVRLPGGNTLVAAGQRVVELDRTGQEVWSFQPEGRPFRLHRR